MQLTIMINKKQITIETLHMYVYKQSKVIEAVDKNNRYYYLVFYHNQYINGVKTTKIKIGSHMHRALTNGIPFPSDHPFINTLLNKEMFSCIKFNQLYTKLQQKYSPTETALILSFFDTFTSPNSIQKLLKKTFYSYRRNGKLRKAFQILYILKQVDSTDTFALDMIGKMEFQNYRTLYQALDTLEQHDAVNFESLCFEQLTQHDIQRKLIDFYTKNNRLLDASIVRIFLLRQQFQPFVWHELLTSLSDWEVEAQIKILLDLNQHNPHPDFEKELISRLLHSSYHKETISFLIEHEYVPTTDESSQVIYHLNHTDPQQLVDYFHLSRKKLLQLHKHLPKKQLEQIITPFVKAFMPIFHLSEIQAWIKSVKEEEEHFLIEKTLKNIENLQDDPDRQYKLGELYVSLDQLDKAIECFKWEVELDPNNTKVIKTIIKLSKQMGNDSEAAVYQDLLIQTQKYV
ncbi:hypothetical protein [Paraliobacillus sp. JSM ZJ581]|uniref:hypothetical protein n=1 Tax=Paraliobacillus sp. JSM ZJ581 TaxID=3342118 RepID=UPI0035A895D6